MKVYVLLLEKKKYFVGATDGKISECLANHLSGAFEWSAKYKPIKILDIIENADEWDEIKMLYKYMNIHGIRNVRGCCYSSLNMDEKDIESIEKILKNKKCYGCGGDHFFRNCVMCYRCGRRGHVFNDCFSASDVDGGCLVRCARCGKKNHWAGTCTESVGIDGARLEPNVQSGIKSYLLSYFK